MLENETKPKAISNEEKKQLRVFENAEIPYTEALHDIDKLKPQLTGDFASLIEHLKRANPEIYDCLQQANNLETARSNVYRYLENQEQSFYQVHNNHHPLETSLAFECIRVFKNILAPINEDRCEVSALSYLWQLSQGNLTAIETQISISFLMEFIHLFLGIKADSKVYPNIEQNAEGTDFLDLTGKSAAEARTDALDELGTTLRKYLTKYPSGLDDEIIKWREENRTRIMRYFNATEDDWNNYSWHIRNIIKDASVLTDLIHLPENQRNAIEKTVENKVPFGITPYYLSLMDSNPSLGFDHAIRAQVLPDLDYVDKLECQKSESTQTLDFMGEHDTSPAPLITRRYPCIAIFKPYNTCAQICVYCQRNWEIDECLSPKAMASQEEINTALKWFDEHKSVGEILLTGGDPLVMREKTLKKILDALSARDHIYRIRIGTRTPVVLPMRWTDELVQLIKQYHIPGKREISVVTHFEHAYEITPDAMQAVRTIRDAGMMVYNQQVYTIECARRFETTKLRRELKRIGIDPYYTFNMKGKEETKNYMVPMARILQEQKEEARLLPGLDRTDELVFNVPRLGKNYLRARLDHRVIMINPDGSRVYEFHPWEKNIRLIRPYLYPDVPIYDFLVELASRGENIQDYRSIWYYY